MHLSKENFKTQWDISLFFRCKRDTNSPAKLMDQFISIPIKILKDDSYFEI